MNALSLACAMVVLAILAHTTLAQNSQQDYIDAHNKARAAVGVGDVSWNNTVQQYAQTYADSRKGDCQLMHSGGPYGENLYGGPIPDPERFTGLDAMNAWVDEKQYYDYNTNSCANGQQCGHYTQVVWRNSNQIGCARVVCDNNSGIFIICNYYPPGNYVGQKPY